MRQTNLKFFLLNIFTLCSISLLFAQTSTLEAYVFEDGNRGYLTDVAIQITQKNENKFIINTASNDEGFFAVSLPIGKTYLISFPRNKYYGETKSTKSKGFC